MFANKGNGFFVVVDGIDGCGKTSVITALKEYLILNNPGASALDVIEYWKHCNNYPSWEEVMPHKLIFTGEPTHVWIGRAIRDELIRNGTDYSVGEIANAYSMDRSILFHRIIVPARAAGKIIIQDRSVSTSIVYQSVQEHGISYQEVAALPGNAFTLEHAPDMLMIPLVNPDVAMGRITGRLDKNDNAIFEKREFLSRADVGFRSDWFKEFFESKGTRVVYLDGSKTRGEVAHEAIRRLNEVMSAL